MKKFKLYLITVIGLFLLFLGFTTKTVMGDTSTWPKSVPAPPPSSLQIRDVFTRVSNTQGDISSKYPQALVVTPYAKNQIGGIWSNQRIDLNNSFDYSMWLYLGDHNGTYGDDTSASDGIAFLMQNDSRKNQAIGTAGGGMGAYTWGVEGRSGYVKNALAIEMDSWWNGISNMSAEHFDLQPSNVLSPEGTPLVGVPGGGGTGSETTGHTGFVQPRDTGRNSNLGHLVAWYDANNDIANNHWRRFVIHWVPKVTWHNGVRKLGGTISYEFGANWDSVNQSVDNGTIMPGTKSWNITDVNNYFAGSSVLFGFTGSTGGAYPNFQAASMDKLPQTAKPVLLDFVEEGTGTKLADTVQLNGEVGSPWNGADRRQNWIQYQGNWYQYTEKYTADTPDQKDKGTFSDTTQYHVVYEYKKVEPPADYALKKSVRNITNGDTDWKTETEGQAKDEVSYELDYTNLTNISTGHIEDKLPNDVTYEKGTLQIADPDNNWEFTTVDDSQFISNSTVNFPYTVPAGGAFKLRLKAKINDDVASEKVITNNAIATDGNSTVKSNDANINIKAKTGSIVIRYVDRTTGALIKTAPNTNGTGRIEYTDDIGKSVSDIANKNGITDWLTPESIDGYTPIDQAITESEVLPSDTTFTGVEKSDPKIDKVTKVYTYRYQQSSYAIDAPSDWEFGEFPAKSEDQTYYLPAAGEENKKTPYSVKVTDSYGLDSWTLSVKQEGQFKSEAIKRTDETDDQWQAIVDKGLDQAHELTNGDLSAEYLTSKVDKSFEETTNGELVNKTDFDLGTNGTGNIENLMTFTKSGHFGTKDNIENDELAQKYDNPGYTVSSLNFGDSKQADYSVGLHVPKETKRYQTRYKTTLAWTLNVAP